MWTNCNIHTEYYVSQVTKPLLLYWWGVPSNHYPWCIGPHYTGTPPLDMGSHCTGSPLTLVPASGIWWPILETCLKLFTWGPPPISADIWWLFMHVWLARRRYAFHWNVFLFMAFFIVLFKSRCTIYDLFNMSTCGQILIYEQFRNVANNGRNWLRIQNLFIAHQQHPRVYQLLWSQWSAEMSVYASGWGTATAPDVSQFRVPEVSAALLRQLITFEELLLFGWCGTL